MESPCCSIVATANSFRNMSCPSVAESYSLRSESVSTVPTAYKANPPAVAAFLSHMEKIILTS